MKSTSRLIVWCALATQVWFDAGFGELRKINPPCSNSCRSPGPHPSTYCYCDSKCSLLYNDCCLDAPYRAVRAAFTRRPDLDCVYVHGENRHFLMVKTCSESWSGHEQIRHKCTQSYVANADNGDVLGNVPVTNPEEEVTYKNYYCSLCNEEDIEDLVEWRIKAICHSRSVTQEDVLRNLTFVDGTQNWGVWKRTISSQNDTDGSWEFHECHLLFQRPKNATPGIRFCTSGMVSSCPPSWKNMAVRRKCHSYVDPVKWTRGPIYKNMDCAICHNQTRRNFQCISDITRDSNAALLDLAFHVDLNSLGPPV